MIQPLLTPQEVIKYTNLPIDYPLCEIRELGKLVYNEFSTCLGIDFYNHIVSKLVDYSTTMPYVLGNTYIQNDVVANNGVLWKCKVATTTDAAGHLNSWQLAPKFSEPCLNDFWCDYLAPYLSWVVRKAKEPFWFYEIKKVKPDGYVGNAASTALLNTIMTQIRENIATEYLILDKFLKDNKDTCSFSLYPANQKNNDACGCELDNSCATSKVFNANVYEIW